MAPPLRTHSLIVSGSGSGQSSGEGAYFQSILELLAQVDPAPLPPTEHNLGERDLSCISLLQTVDQRVGFLQGHIDVAAFTA